jgi:hypothetical protein
MLVEETCSQVSAFEEIQLRLSVALISVSPWTNPPTRVPRQLPPRAEARRQRG